MQSEHFYSRGKFLLTSEYLVLKGAKALAVPLKYGQSTEIISSQNTQSFECLSFENQKQWFKAIFDSNNLNIIETSEEKSALFIQKLLKAIKVLKPNLSFSKVSKIINKIDFNRFWGLGTSSTIINNLAQWAKINPYELHFSVSNGSAYDIAAANAENPFFYSLNQKTPKFEEIKWDIPFKKQIFFVYLEKKQNSEQSVNQFNKKQTFDSDVKKISDLTNELLNLKEFTKFAQILEEHESIIGNILQKQPIKQNLFSDFKGQIKSLGAWGGDFCMVISSQNSLYVKNYFKQKGFNTLFNYSEIVYEQNINE
ncbi:MAG: hypothetical protein KAI79_17930 [Bacteroidales bacterium]|nr:hypothetical protein [Bacteroidales bacterium]